MRPSKNAFIGYSYQQCVTFLLLAKMDSERHIEKIEMEADVDNNFDDVEVTCAKSKYNLQIKDFKMVSLDNLKISGDYISINGKSHVLSKNINVLFLKYINTTPNCEVFGLPALKKSDIYIISLTKYGKTSVSDFADVKLYSVAEAESLRLSSILARTAQEFIIDILFIAITQSSRQSRKLLEKTNAIVSDFRGSTER